MDPHPARPNVTAPQQRPSRGFPAALVLPVIRALSPIFPHGYGALNNTPNPSFAKGTLYGSLLPVDCPLEVTGSVDRPPICEPLSGMSLAPGWGQAPSGAL